MLSSINTIWVLLGGVLVFFMQAGFAMVETGLTRAKNAGNIIMKNLMDFSLGTLVYWIQGFGLMFGADLAGFIGTPDFFVLGDYTTDTNVSTTSFLIFQTVFCATASTIVSGAMAERTKFISYCIYSVVISALIYPITGHWIWGGGWLANLGFVDFAGSIAVHMVGGVCALVGAKLVGPRIGKYDKEGKPKAIPGHSLTLAALGVFILWFGWFGFNGGSTLAADSNESLLSIGRIFINTNIAAATAATVVMIITWIKYKKPDVSMSLNGALAGLVAITAGCEAVSPLGALVIGALGGVVVIFGVEFIDKVLKIDDPVGAIGVHGMAGALGTVLVGFFAKDGGLFYGGGFKLLGVQALGVLTVMAFVGTAAFLTFFAIKKTIGLRVSREEELVGLDIKEHNLAASYADFMPYPLAVNGIKTEASIKAQKAMSQTSNTQVEYYPKENETVKDLLNKKMSKLVIIFNQNKYEAFIKAMNEIGITGMTLSYVHGCGLQKGRDEYYRGVKYDINLLPKVKVEIVVSQIPVDTVIEKTKAVLKTGNIGDGKIFVYDVERVVKVRTGEENYYALQDCD